jgi:hypothetical protein
MKTRTPLVLAAVLYLVFFGALLGAFERLPDPVASHFSGRGVPDGWMTRGQYLAFTIGLAIFLPGIVVGLGFALRYMPPWTFNLPNRDYWLAPERRAQTNAHFFRHALWFACLAILFALGIHLTIVEANSQLPPRLSLPLLLLTAGGFLVGILIWILLLLRPFYRRVPPQEAAPPSASRSVA